MALDAQRCPDCGGDLLSTACSARRPIPHSQRLRSMLPLRTPPTVLELLERAEAVDLVRLLPALYGRRIVRHAEEGGTIDADDDQRSPTEWCIEVYARWGQADGSALDGDLSTWRERLLRVAELALAAVASHDRKVRGG